MMLYIGSIATISRLGGWSHNEWIRGLIFHHEYLIAFYVGFAETKHFSFFMGPKFTIFYNVFTRYETKQLFLNWADTIEENQLEWLRHTKEQIEYVRINSEYDFIKKRSLVNFLTNEKLNLELSFHQRASNMLKLIANFEQQNLTNHMKQLAVGSLEKLHTMIKDPVESKSI